MSTGGLKSTYKPTSAQAPLPPGWTEHTAPSGHTYYYHAETKESTYKRPGQAPIETPQPQYQAVYPNLSDPNVANAYLAQFQQPAAQWNQRGGHGGRGRGGGRGGGEARPRPQPIDKPRRKEVIPGCEPWILVYTKYSRRFVYNPEKNTSYWRIPEKLMPGILELDKARIRGKAAGDDGEKQESKEDTAAGNDTTVATDDKMDGDSSEYEEVEVTDDEGADEEDDGHPSKRQRTEEPVEFTEEDIAMQLQAMGEDYGLEPGDYDDGNMEDWPEGTEGVAFSEEDAKLLFKDLLDDFNINPYSPWDKLIEDGLVMDDPRYTALSTTRARRECWDEWSRERIAARRAQRAAQEKTDPRVGYMAFLAEKATPKLYWPEFKRKYRKEPAMRAPELADRDREKAYRDHVARLKQPQAARKADLTALLKAQPLHVLNRGSLTKGLPTAVLVDARYAALEPAVRDPLVEAYVQGLDAAPDEEGNGGGGSAQEAAEAREKRERRERALAERDRAVEEARRQREREVARSKARLRDGEREVEVAMRVNKDGLRRQLMGEKEEKEKEVQNDETQAD
jgi:hypothetical protein